MVVWVAAFAVGCVADDVADTVCVVGHRDDVYDDVGYDGVAARWWYDRHRGHARTYPNYAILCKFRLATAYFCGFECCGMTFFYLAPGGVVGLVRSCPFLPGARWGAPLILRGVTGVVGEEDVGVGCRLRFLRRVLMFRVAV